jgi:hypothetical protein
MVRVAVIVKPWAAALCGGMESADERRERLAQALRANLRRRKAQAREGSAGEPFGAPGNAEKRR